MEFQKLAKVIVDSSVLNITTGAVRLAPYSLEGVMSRAKYLKNLERTIEAMKKATNDLTRENYELRQLLNAAARQPQQSSHSSIS